MSVITSIGTFFIAFATKSHDPLGKPLDEDAAGQLRPPRSQTQSGPSLTGRVLVVQGLEFA